MARALLDRGIGVEAGVFVDTGRFRDAATAFVASPLAGVVTRVRVYQHAGYFPPAEMDELIARVSQAVVTEPSRLLANFVARYA